MHCFEVVVTDYRPGRFLPDILPPIIGHARYDICPIMPDITGWVKRLEASNHKAYSHYRRQGHKPIETDNFQISGWRGAYKAPPPIWPIKTACAGGL
jgi:hypothetical protein